MEEEILGPSPIPCTDSVLQQPQNDSWTSIDPQCINGEQDAIVRGETEVEIKQAHGADELNQSPKTGQEIPEEAEQWEQMIWSVRPLTCATVQWDMPGPLAEEPPLTADGSSAGEMDSQGALCLDSTSPSSQRSDEGDDHAGRLTEGEREEKTECDSQLLNLNLQKAANRSEPCDAADVKEPTTQEKEDSAHEPVNKEIRLGTDSGEEDGHTVTPAPVESVETEDSENEVDIVENLEPEEEQDKTDVLLTAEDRKASSNGVEIEEKEEEEEEEHIVTNALHSNDSKEGKTVIDTSDVEVSAEPLQSDFTGPTLDPETLSEILEERGQSGTEEDIQIHELIEEPEMCEDVDHKVEPEQPHTAGHNEGASIQEAENAERIENLEEVLGLVEKAEEKSFAEHQDCDQATPQETVTLPQPDRSEGEQVEMAAEPEPMDLEEKPEMEGAEQSAQAEPTEPPKESAQCEQAVCAEAEGPKVSGVRQQTEPNEAPTLSEQRVQSENSDEVTQQTAAEAGPKPVGGQVGTLGRAEELKRGPQDGDVLANGEHLAHPDTDAPDMNGAGVDREMARDLAERLFKLDGIQRVDVVKHLDKDNDFSRTVGEEYLKLFDFTGKTLDHALRSFLKVVVLIGESQERERVLMHFACRFHRCNPDAFSSSWAVLALTCALMLLNTDLHGQHVGKSMSSSKFVSNLETMNEGENFDKDLLKSLYNSIKSEPLEWAIDAEELNGSAFLEEDTGDIAPLCSKANPFQVFHCDQKAQVVKEGFLKRKIHADIDGKRTPWGKRGWKTFYGVLKGMVLYLQKDDYGRDQQTIEEVVSLHHSLAEPAADYTKKPHVFRLQTADWRVFLFQASSKVEMNSWISRLNLVCALQSSPPFPAAVGSQRKFFRPILPASMSSHSLERQLQSHAGLLVSFKADLLYLQQNPPEGRKAKAKELEELRVRTEYLQYEMCRYEIYVQVLEGWKNLEKTGNNVFSSAALTLFDKRVCAASAGEDEGEGGGLTKSHSSPSLELEMAPPTVVKVRRNISERRTYRRTIVPRWNKEA